MRQTSIVLATAVITGTVAVAGPVGGQSQFYVARPDCTYL
jgi:hypothetical protein